MSNSHNNRKKCVHLNNIWRKKQEKTVPADQTRFKDKVSQV